MCYVIRVYLNIFVLEEDDIIIPFESLKRGEQNGTKTSTPLSTNISI